MLYLAGLEGKGKRWADTAWPHHGSHAPSSRLSRPFPRLSSPDPYWAVSVLHWNADMPSMANKQWITAMQSQTRVLVLCGLTHPLASLPSPHLTFFACSFYSNTWLGRLKWWHEFSSSSYLCRCSGRSLISRYSLASCRSTCQPAFTPLSCQSRAKRPGDAEHNATASCPGACQGSAHPHHWPNLCSPAGHLAQKVEKNKCSV